MAFWRVQKTMEDEFCLEREKRWNEYIITGKPLP